MKTFLLSLVLAGCLSAQYLPPSISDLTAVTTREQFNFTTAPLDNQRIENLYVFYGGNLCIVHYGRDTHNQWYGYGALYDYFLGYIQHDGGAPVSNGYCTGYRLVSSESVTARSVTAFLDMGVINLPNTDVEVYSITMGAFNYRKFVRSGTAAKPRMAVAADRQLSWNEGWTELATRINQGHQADRDARK